MATNGQVETNTGYDSKFWVKWEQVGDQDIANNRTQIKWTCGLYSTHKFYTNAVKMSAVSINGTQVFSGGTYSNFTSEGNQTIASGTLWIAHNADGTKSFSISSFTGWLYSNHNYSSNGGTFTLNAIPRQALITSVSDFTELDNPSITFSNPGGFRMDVWLEPNPVGDHLCERNNIPNTGSYTWSLTSAERDALRNKCAGTKCTIRVGLYSFVGDTTYADYKDKTFTIKESDATKPTVSMSISLNNDFHPFPENLGDIYIQGKSKVNVTLSAKGKYNSTIKSYSATVDGKTYNSSAFTSDVVQNAGKVNVIGSAVDSRGFTCSKSQQIDVVAYSKPSVIPLGIENAILCYRSDGNGNRIGNSTSVWIKAKRSYYNLGGKNTCAFEWRRKLVTEEWDDDHVWLPLNTTTDEYNALIPDAVFELKQSYTVQIRAIDYIGEQDVKTFEIPTQDVALHLGRGGKNVSVGTYCDYSEDYTFYSEWKAIFDKEVVIGGSPVADHIVERGTGGIWTYEKLASGIARCWAKIDYTADLAGVGVRSYVRIGKGFPVTFKSVPFCNCTLANQTTWNHILSSVDFTESMVVAISVYRLGEGVNVTAGGTADIMVIGYWK